MGHGRGVNPPSLESLIFFLLVPVSAVMHSRDRERKKKKVKKRKKDGNKRKIV